MTLVPVSIAEINEFSLFWEKNVMACPLRKVSQGAKLNMNVKGRANGAIGSFAVKPSPQGPV